MLTAKVHATRGINCGSCDKILDLSRAQRQLNWEYLNWGSNK